MRSPREALAPDQARRHRTIFISDVHLGTPGCKAELLADFLAHNDCRTLYLVGDIVDFWRLKRSWFWSAAHSRVINAILAKVKGGTRVIYVPGNHDEPLRDYDGMTFGEVAVVNEIVHVTADGKRYLVAHGDAFDGVIKYAKWLAYLGDTAYALALNLNHWYNHFRVRLGLQYWSLSAYLKTQVKDAVKFISDFEDAMAAEARRQGLDGVICGHIHKAESRMIDGVHYINDGDWVESCTALVEHMDGKLEIVEWAANRNFSMLAPNVTDEIEERRVPA
jgi:UDP-2,3-diacylglucosamine pyrophosphatase LpxH